MADSAIRGHGWVTPLPSGAVARCGGPGMCSHCQLEQRVIDLGSALAKVIFERDGLVTALTDLLAAVDVVTLADPTHYVVANAVALPALVARGLLQRHGRPIPRFPARTAAVCAHGHDGCCGHHDVEDMPIHARGERPL